METPSTDLEAVTSSAFATRQRTSNVHEAQRASRWSKNASDPTPVSDETSPSPKWSSRRPSPIIPRMACCHWILLITVPLMTISFAVLQTFNAGVDVKAIKVGSIITFQGRTGKVIWDGRPKYDYIEMIWMNDGTRSGIIRFCDLERPGALRSVSQAMAKSLPETSYAAATISKFGDTMAVPLPTTTKRMVTTTVTQEVWLPEIFNPRLRNQSILPVSLPQAPPQAPPQVPPQMPPQAPPKAPPQESLSQVVQLSDDMNRATEAHAQIPKEEPSHTGMVPGKKKADFKRCKAVSLEDANDFVVDFGAEDAYRGWYDTMGCGQCLDYCRWVGTDGSGGDPQKRKVHHGSWWSCAIMGHDSAFTKPNHFRAPGFHKARCANYGEWIISREAMAPDASIPPPPQTLTGRLVEKALKCKASNTNTNYPGFQGDEHRGWYDVTGCGYCYDFCRWLGLGRPGTGQTVNPWKLRRTQKAWWSCSLAGDDQLGYTLPGQLRPKWNLTKCSGMGAPSQNAYGVPVLKPIPLGQG